MRSVLDNWFQYRQYVLTCELHLLVLFHFHRHPNLLNRLAETTIDPSAQNRVIPTTELRGGIGVGRRLVIKHRLEPTMHSANLGCLLAWALWLGLVVSTRSAFSQQGSPNDSEDGIGTEMAERWRAVLDEISTSFQVNRNGATLTELHKSPVLNLWNPANLPSPRLGRVYLWTEEGRPVLLASIFTGTGLGFRETVNIIYEFHSLDSEPIQVAQRQVLLDCPTEGIEWLRLEDGNSPSSSRVQRMVQMRGIARSFQVSGTTLENDTTFFGLLPNPVYRYERETSEAADGAIFAIGKATDPNVYLLIEGRKDAWWVAFARSSVIALRIERNNKLFYKFDPTSAKKSGTPFYIDWIAERRAASSPETEISIAK